MKLYNGNEYKFINRSDIAIIEMVKYIDCDNTALEDCLKILTNNIVKFFEQIYNLNQSKRIILFIRTQSFQFLNAINKKKGVWGITGLTWFNNSYRKTVSFEQKDSTGVYNYGIAEITIEDLFYVLNYSRLSKRVIILFTDQLNINNSLQYFTNEIIDNKEGIINWKEAINKLCFNNNIILKVDGEFDDINVCVSFFMKKELQYKLKFIEFET